MTTEKEKLQLELDRTRLAYEKANMRAMAYEAETLRLQQETRKLTSKISALEDMIRQRGGSSLVPIPIEASHHFNEANHFLHLYNGPLNLVLDIGAHIGSLSVLAVRKGADRVIAFEPNPEVRKQLAENFRLYNCRQASIVDKAVGGVGGLRRLYIPKGLEAYDTWAGTGQSSLVIEREDWELVEVVPFTDVLLAHPIIDYLKIDVEEAEYEMFHNLTPDHLRGVRFLDLDIHNHYGQWEAEATDFVRFITWLGFEEDAYPNVQMGSYDIGRFNVNFKGE